MPKKSFFKMQGAGNDYIYFDCLEHPFENPEIYVPILSDRHFGIGGDGVVLLERSDVADVKMRMFNADGSEGKMCGNAVRCIARYCSERGISQKGGVSIETASGVKSVFCRGEGRRWECSVWMGRAEFQPELVPCLFSAWEEKLPLPCGKVTCYALSMGNPHCVVFAPLAAVPLEETAKALLAYFPQGVNVEVAEQNCEESFTARVYERGSGETLACGTGACAIVAAAVRSGRAQPERDYAVHLPGGTLKIKYTESGILLTGGAETVFTGEINL